MNAALRYLLARSIANGVKSRLKRLRQPKYLIGAVLGAAYFYLYFYLFLGKQVAAQAPTMPTGSSIAMWALVLFGATLVLSWILPASRAAISFSEAEIAFLFPAPVSRRALVIHKLLRSQFALLMLSALMTLISGRFRLGAQAWFAMGTLWVIFNTLNMHRIGASFALQRLRERGLADGKRRLALLIAIGALAATVEYTRRGFAMPAALPDGSPNIPAIFEQIINHGPLPYVLVPFKMMIAPFVARDPLAFAFAILPALGIMAVHFIWVVRADTAFEEAAISSAQKRAAFIASAKSGEFPFAAKSTKARTPIWRLRTTGFAPTAFVWRSFIKFGGRRALVLFLLLFTFLAFAAWFIRQHTRPGGDPTYVVAGVIIGVVCYLTILLSLVLVGQSASGQLRKGMTMMDLLKTYPIPGWQLALGEILGPILAGTLLQWCALAIGAYLALAITNSHAGIVGITVTACFIGVGLPVFNAGMSILPAGTALLFPGWFKPADAAAPGLEQTGVRLIMGIGQLLGIAIAMVPPVFFGACAWLACERLRISLPWQAGSSAVIAAGVFALEAALGIVWLGRLYDRYDGSSE